MNVMTLIAAALAGWINREQQDVIEYLREEVRVLKELQGKRRLRFTDEQRRRLARKAKRRGGELPRAAWRIAPLLPGRGMKPTIPISGHYGVQAGLV